MLRALVRSSLVLFLAVPVARAQLAVDADTVALWHFDEGTGSIAADSGGLGSLAFLRYPSDGSAGSTFPTWSEGCVGGAVDLAKGDSNQSGGYLYRNDSHAFDQNAVTVELLLRTTSANAVLFWGGFAQLYLSLESNGSVRTTAGDGNDWGPSAISDVAVNDGAWHYVAGTYDGSHVRTYVDGVERAASAYDGTIGTLTGFFVGGRGSNTFFEGTIDEVRLSDAARSDAAIEATWDELAVLCPEPAGGGLAAGVAVALLGARRRR